MFFISRTNKADGGRMIEILNLIAISIFLLASEEY